MTASSDKTNDVTTSNVPWYQLHKNVHDFFFFVISTALKRITWKVFVREIKINEFMSYKGKLTIYVDTIPKLWSIHLRGHNTNIKKNKPLMIIYKSLKHFQVR
jgi:hypothetical protein